MRLTLATPLCLACVLMAGAQAAPSRQTIGATGGFVTTCISATTNGTGFNPGDNFEGDYPAGDCSFGAFSGNSSAQSLATPVAGDNILGGAFGSISLGALHLGTEYALQTGGHFPAAAVTGGFNVLLTPQLQGHTGEAGFLLIDFDVSGGLKAHGNAGSAQFQLELFKNNAPLAANAPGYNPGIGTEATTDRQWLTWKANSFPVPDEGDIQDVDEIVTFSVPVVWGTQIQLGVYGSSRSGGRNQGGAGSSQSDFSHSVYWAGVPGAMVGGQFVASGLSIDSATGIDWMASLVPGTPNDPGTVPLPGTTPLLLAAWAALTLARKAGRRAR